MPPLDDEDETGGDDRKEQPDGDKGKEDESEVRTPIEIPSEILDSLPDEVREIVLQAASFSGPLPPSPTFREYEDVLPGAADRILGMAERQAEHRQEWEKNALRSAQRDSMRVQWLGFSISLVALIAATYLAMNGHIVMPILLGGGGLSGLVANFINAVRRRQSSDDD